MVDKVVVVFFFFFNAQLSFQERDTKDAKVLKTRAEGKTADAVIEGRGEYTLRTWVLMLTRDKIVAPCRKLKLRPPVKAGTRKEQQQKGEAIKNSHSWQKEKAKKFECLGLWGQDAPENFLNFWAHTSCESENLNVYFLCGLGNITPPTPSPGKNLQEN